MDVIIGAGVSGLSYAAAKGGDYMILEAEGEIGGYCKTIHQDGYIWDYSGHFFHFRRNDLRDFVMKGIRDDEVLTVKKHTQILYRDRYVDFPFQMNIHQLPKDEFVDCLYDLFSTDSDASVSTFKEMLYAKFGKSIAEKFLIPYNSKLYATDLDRLDVDAMGRFFPYANREQIILNFRKKQSSTYNDTFIYPKDGCGRIVESIASNVDRAKIYLNEKVDHIDIKNHTVTTNIRVVNYDRIVSTMPLPKLLDLCGIAYDRNIYSWNKVLVFNLGFDSKGDDVKNCWVYVPSEDLPFYRVGYYDNILNQDRMSLYVELGFGKDAEVPPVDEVLSMTLDGLRQSGIVTSQKLVSCNHVLMDPAYVHITKKSEADKVSKMSELSKGDVYSIGRYGEWKYCSLEDNIGDAFDLAKKMKSK